MQRFYRLHFEILSHTVQTVLNFVSTLTYSTKVQQLHPLLDAGQAASTCVRSRPREQSHTHQSPAGALFAGATICRVRSWMSAWVFLLLGGMDSVVFGPIRWCVWSFRLSSPLRLPHLKFLFVCLSYAWQAAQRVLCTSYMQWRYIIQTKARSLGFPKHVVVCKHVHVIYTSGYM